MVLCEEVGEGHLYGYRREEDTSRQVVVAAGVLRFTVFFTRY